MIIGIIIGVLATIIVFLLIDKFKPKKISITKIELSEDDKKKQEKIKKSFDNLMNYDYDKALKKGE